MKISTTLYVYARRFLHNLVRKTSPNHQLNQPIILIRLLSYACSLPLLLYDTHLTSFRGMMAWSNQIFSDTYLSSNNRSYIVQRIVDRETSGSSWYSSAVLYIRSYAMARYKFRTWCMWDDRKHSMPMDF